MAAERTRDLAGTLVKDVRMNTSGEAAVQPATTRIAEFVAGVQAAELPAEVTHEAVRCLVNFVGCALGGRSHDVVRIADGALSPWEGAAVASVVGARRRTDPLLAALINGTAASAHSFDDTHAQAVVHAGAPVVGATLAMAQAQHAGGHAMLSAIALGAEVTFRLSKALSVSPAINDIAWYQTGVTGGIGAAVAAGRLLGLDASGMRAAMGIAVSQASGPRVTQGSMCMLMLAGHAAQTGVRAALLAAQGFEGLAASIEGKHGFLDVFSERAHIDWLVADLGSRYELLSNNHKAYPCGVVLHPVVDACIELRNTHHLEVDEIDSIAIRVHPMALALTDRRHPATRTEGQVSIHHWAAVALALDGVGLREGTLPVLQSPGMVALRERVHPAPDATLARDEAQVSIRVRSGVMMASSVHRGCVPMDDGALERKFRSQAMDVYDEAHAARLVQALWNIASAADLRSLSDLL